LRLVRAARRGGGVWEWEHEEYDACGALVALYESRSRGAASPAGGQGGGGGFVKYSPNGWVLGRSNAAARRPAHLGEEVFWPMDQPPGPHSSRGAGRLASAARPDRPPPESAGRTEAWMDAAHGADRRAAAEQDSDTSLRVRAAIADTAFVTEGIALGLALKWTERDAVARRPTAAGRPGRRRAGASRPLAARRIEAAWRKVRGQLSALGPSPGSIAFRRRGSRNGHGRSPWRSPPQRGGTRGRLTRNRGAAGGRPTGISARMVCTQCPESPCGRTTFAHCGGALRMCTRINPLLRLGLCHEPA
jgi:hypothetical protein